MKHYPGLLSFGRVQLDKSDIWCPAFKSGRAKGEVKREAYTAQTLEPPGKLHHATDNLGTNFRGEHMVETFHTDEPMPAVLPDWTPFQKATPTLNGFVTSFSQAEKEEFLRVMERMVIYTNSRYMVTVVRTPKKGYVEIYLAIKDKWRSARHDWRDFQRIKNELLGPEQEMIEIYPAESRLHDSANQFHLWGVEGKGMGMGFEGREVGGPEEAAPHGAVQRPFEQKVEYATLSSNLVNKRSMSVKTISRNAPCPCGSGKKYKRCCAR